MQVATGNTRSNDHKLKVESEGPIEPAANSFVIVLFNSLFLV